MTALRIARGALLVSITLYVATMAIVLAGYRAPALLSIGICSMIGIEVSAVACVVLQTATCLARRLRR